MIELTTDRLYIRSLRPGDWTQMKRIFPDFASSKYAVYDGPLPVEDEAVETLTAKFAESDLFFAVFLTGTSEMLGYVCFHKNEEEYDLGYCFHSAYHRCGYAFESAAALMQYFREQSGVSVFTAGTALENVPSCRLLERLGFTCRSVEEVSFHEDSAGKPIVFRGGNFVCERVTPAAGASGEL